MIAAPRIGRPEKRAATNRIATSRYGYTRLRSAGASTIDVPATSAPNRPTSCKVGTLVDGRSKKKKEPTPVFASTPPTRNMVVMRNESEPGKERSTEVTRRLIAERQPARRAAQRLLIHVQFPLDDICESMLAANVVSSRTLRSAVVMVRRGLG